MSLHRDFHVKTQTFMPFSPVIDGKIVTDQPFKIIRDNKHPAQVPFILVSIVCSYS